MKGRTCLVTGASGGIGKECAVALATMGATVVGVGRDPQRSEQALNEIRLRSGNGAVEMLRGDFAQLADVRRIAAEFRDRHARLHVLVNNAGTVYGRHELTLQGVEKTFAVNHLGYFLLTRELLPLLQASAPARVVSVASMANYRGSLDVADLAHRKGWNVGTAYARSKLCNVLFTKELARRIDGTGVTANCLHPGVVATDIWGRSFLSRVYGWIVRFKMITPAQGADTMTWLASDPSVAHVSGEYFDTRTVRKPNKVAEDRGLALALWEASERLVAAPAESSGAGPG
ncbi:MAG: SDR family oxidoreductase [Myxococcales bacterium]|nr:SDR family oxidoreductase [Myxococcales bacterium]